MLPQARHRTWERLQAYCLQAATPAAATSTIAATCTTAAIITVGGPSATALEAQQRLLTEVKQVSAESSTRIKYWSPCHQGSLIPTAGSDTLTSGAYADAFTSSGQAISSARS